MLKAGSNRMFVIRSFTNVNCVCCWLRDGRIVEVTHKRCNFGLCIENGPLMASRFYLDVKNKMVLPIDKMCIDLSIISMYWGIIAVFYLALTRYTTFVENIVPTPYAQFARPFETTSDT